MAIVTMIIIILVNLILQSTLLPFLSFLKYLPNLGLVSVVAIGLIRGRYYGGFFGLALGLAQDILFGRVIGVNAFIYFMLGYLVGYVQASLNQENLAIPLTFSALGTIFYNFLYFLFMYFLSIDIEFSTALTFIFSIEILYNGLISIFVYKLFTKIIKVPSLRFGRR